MPDPKAVNGFFSDIAEEYDVTNRVLSSGIDMLWRRYLAKRVSRHNPERLLDLATGSGDVAFTLAKNVDSLQTITATDFCRPMLEVADRKKASKKRSGIITFDFADCLELPFEAQSFDAITISFGLRNLSDRHRGLSEMLRVLRPGGWLYVLEFTQPNKMIRGPYYWYLKNIIPHISGNLTGNKDAYEYLGSSIETFPNKETLDAELTNAGFQSIYHRGLTGSIVSVHEGRKVVSN